MKFKHMNRIIIVSNRLLVKIKEETKGNYQVTPSSGGLATGMKSVYKNYNSLWFGWSGLHHDELTAQDQQNIEELLEQEQCISVPLNKEQVDNYYYGFSNKTIWPLFHYFTQFAEYKTIHWETYKAVNEKFAEVLKPYLRADDKIWIHDYHLLLLPQMIRDYMPEADIGFFLHIPFPSYEVFRLLPWREEVLQGILGADLIGFHTYDYERHFMSSIRRLLGYENTYNRINYGNRVIKVDAYPMGIDFDKYHNAAKEAVNKEPCSVSLKHIEKFCANDNGKQLILSMDRLDYTKGINNRLLAYERFLEDHPEKHEKVVLFVLTVPSRTSVDRYQMLKKEIDEAVGRINSKFGTVGWMPIWYLFRAMPFDQLIELYAYSDVAINTPIRDGMNLIAKEYIACRVNYTGVLILSEMAGASKELGEALIVNPNNIQQMADTIDYALKMPVEKQKRSNKLMIERLKRYNVDHWSNDFIQDWHDVKQMQSKQKTKEIHPQVRKDIAEKYRESSARLLMIDYDGTLAPFSDYPDEVEFPEKSRKILENLTHDEKNDIYLISGRKKEYMDYYFNDENIGLIAEHGIWIKHPGKKWTQLRKHNKQWKNEIREILQIHVDRTPGTYIEEKDYSLAWHYRRADPDLGRKRSWELNDKLRDLVSNLNLEVQEGKKVLEIKPMGVNKGIAASMIIQQKNYEFIMSLGVDWTNEYMFRKIPDYGISIKVGIEQTDAAYYLDSIDKVHHFFEELLNS